MGKDLAVAFSLANLCYLRIWRELLTYRNSDTYLMEAPPQPAEYCAVMLNVLLTGGILFALLHHARLPGHKWTTRLSSVLVGAAFLAALNAVRTAAASASPYLHGELVRSIGLLPTISLAVLLGGSATFTIVHWWRAVFHVACTLLLVLSPFVLITFSQAFSAVLKPAPTSFAQHPLAARFPGPQKTRVLWLLFDELDQRLAFTERRSDLRLPALDRFRAGALQATRAASVSRATLTSVPSSISGRLVQDAQPAGPSTLLLTFSGDPEASAWGSGPDLFARARALGVNSAVAGWYHPYCRVFNESLTACASTAMARQANSVGSGLLQVTYGQTRSLLETSLISPFGQSLTVQHHVRDYQRLLAAGRTFCVDPGLGLVMVHLPVPHTPYIYDPRTGRLDLVNAVLDYESGLALTDKTLGDLRLTMEEAGLWTQTTVLITSDHPYRDAPAYDGKPIGKYVPFLVKFAGQDRGAIYDRQFSTVLIHDLLLEILKGGISTSSLAIRWLDRHTQPEPTSN